MSMQTVSENEVVIACIPEAIPPDKRERWMALGKQVYAAVEEIQELPDGYACRLPNDEAMLVKAAEYISLDRLCCAFMHWKLIVEPHGGPLWLYLTGAEGTKALIQNTFETTNVLNKQVASTAGFDVSAQAVWVHPSAPTVSTA